MRILIADDEALARQRLGQLLGEVHPGADIVEAGNGLEAMRMAMGHRPEIVLLDIRMPGMDGLEAARHMARMEAPPAIIFTTAYDEHALAAFEASAVDYLVKPVRKERLAEALQRARVQQRGRLSALPRAAGMETSRSHLSIRSRDDLVLVPVAEITYLRADQKYVAVGWRGRELLLDEPLRELEEEFGPRFLRVHRNALVARDQVAGLERRPDGSMAIRLIGIAEPIAVSRRHLGGVRAALR